MKNSITDIESILRKSTVYKKKKGKTTYLHVRIASSSEKESLEKLREILVNYNLHPIIMKSGTRYYLLITRKNEVKKIIEEHIGVQNLPPQHRETYEKHYKNPSQWGLKYDLTTALKNPEKAKTVYYLLGAIAGHSYLHSKHRIAIKVTEKQLQQKIVQKAKSLGLHPAPHPQNIEKLVQRIIIGSTHLIRLHQEIVLNPDKLETIPEYLFWAYFEGLYESRGSLRLVENQFEVRMRLRKPQNIQILKHICIRLQKMGIKAKCCSYKEGYAYELRIKDSRSIVMLFTKIDPIIKNPKTGTLSTRIILYAQKRGINPQVISQQWRKRWKEYLEKFAVKR